MIFLPFQLGTFEVNHVSLPGCIQPIQHLHGNDGLQKTCAILRARAALEANHCLPPEIVGRDTWISGGHVFGGFSSKPKVIGILMLNYYELHSGTQTLLLSPRPYSFLKGWSKDNYITRANKTKHGKHQVRESQKMLQVRLYTHVSYIVWSDQVGFHHVTTDFNNTNICMQRSWLPFLNMHLNHLKRSNHSWSVWKCAYIGYASESKNQSTTLIQCPQTLAHQPLSNHSSKLQISKSPLWVLKPAWHQGLQCFLRSPGAADFTSVQWRCWEKASDK